VGLPTAAANSVIESALSSSILQRAGVVPMSIAGIAKEVTTITVSAWFFGDELTPLNIVGVAVTVCGASNSVLNLLG
jgi:multidrug transporter EmrE-like cation transporter